MAVKCIEVEDKRLTALCATHLEIIGQRRQLLGRARCQEELRTGAGKTFRCFLGNCRGRSNNYYFHTIIPFGTCALAGVTRRQKLDENCGSMYCANVCHCGKYCWKLSGDI